MYDEEGSGSRSNRRHRPGDGCVNVIIETPKGSHNKYKYDGK